MNQTRFQIMLVLAAGALFASFAHAQTAANLTIISGNGQVICPACSGAPSFFYQPMVVQATDSFGNPVAGVTVNWSLVSGGGSFFQSGSNTFSSTTDSNGMTSATIQPNLGQVYGNALLSYFQYSVTASSSNASASFTLTQALQDPLNLSQLPVSASVQNSSLVLGQTFSGQVGTSSTTPIQIGVFSQGGVGVPNVALFLVNAKTSGATIQCAPTPTSSGSLPGVNLIVTGANGIAMCYPTFGGSPGTGLFYVVIGGAQSSDPTTPSSAYATLPLAPYNPSTGNGSGFNFTVTPGQPGTIISVSGSGQSANPGQALAQPLVAQVLSGSGQPLSGVTVNWSVSPANAANLSAATTTSTNGQTSNSVTLTSAASGTVTVTATPAGSTSKTTYTINVVPVVVITGFSIVTGNNQSATVGAQFLSQLSVMVTSNAGPAVGVNVNFTVQSGSVTLSSTSVATNSSGIASVTATAGSVPGAAVVVASLSSANGGSTQTFNLVVTPQGPSITASNFYNGADLQPNSFSPCGNAVLIGSGSLGIPNLSPTFPGLPINQTAVSITFNSIPAPILNIGNTSLGQQEVLFQIPCGVSPASSVPVVVNINGTTSNVNLNVQPAAPGMYQTTQSDGVVRGVILRPDGSYATAQNPARRGETCIAYVTGLGATQPPAGTTEVAFPGGTPSTVLGTVIPGISGGGAPLVFAQLSDEIPGIYVVGFQVPTGNPTGDVPFSIGIIPQGGTSAVYTATVKIPVQ